MSVQLYAHSDYTLQGSLLTVEALVTRASELGIRTLAITDHNTTAGHGEFDYHCRKAGIKPIFGLELDLLYPDGDKAPLVILAKNQDGYVNLLCLASEQLPLPWDQLAQFAEGLIVLKGGPKSKIKQLWQMGKLEEAKRLHRWFLNLFGSNYFLRWELGQENLLLQAFPNHPFVLSQAIKYGWETQKRALEVLREIGGQSWVVPPFPMLGWDELTAAIPDAKMVATSLELAKQCKAALPRGLSLPPHPSGRDLTALVRTGAEKRFTTLTKEIEHRLAEELAVIAELGFSDYFLIVADIVNFAKRNDIPVGPGRGSAAGSLVAYCLGITDINPLAYGLLFERFLNRARLKKPDIDLDFCYERRQEVLAYVAERFGLEHVAQIGTYGTFGQKSAEQEVKRVLGKTELALVQQLVGLKRHRSTHAAGLVITEAKLNTITAVYPDRGLPVTQLDMYSLERLGVLKIDLLGLRTLTLLKKIEEAVQRKQPDFALKNIPLTDRQTYAMLGQGKSLGVFQLESSLYQDLLRALKPQTFGDLVALLALGRPGPLDVFPEYLKRRQNPSKINYYNREMAEILEETYGLILYQEQILLLAHKIGGLSLGEADLLRIALSAQESHKIREWRDKFVAGAGKKGIPLQQAQNIFHLMERFSGYAFNKAHSVSYALLTWQGAYLKANYPLEFFAVLLNEGVSKSEQRDYLLECQSLGTEILPPSVLYSREQTILEGNKLRLGLTSIRGIAPAVAKQIIAGRSTILWRDCLELKRTVSLSDRELELLILAGACDDLGSRNNNLQSIGKGPLGTKELLEAEKNLLGIYCSSHPCASFLPLLRNLQGDLEVLAGEILATERRRGNLEGLIDTPAGLVRFRAALNRENSKIAAGQSLALFGISPEPGLWQVEWFLPLGPILLISPKLTELELLKNILAGEHGLRPVILRLGEGEAYHLLPPEFWVKNVEQITKRLEDAKLTQVWFDPWKQNVS